MQLCIYSKHIFLAVVVVVVFFSFFPFCFVLNLSGKTYKGIQFAGPRAVWNFFSIPFWVFGFSKSWNKTKYSSFSKGKSMNKIKWFEISRGKKNKTLSDFGLNFYQKFRDKPILVIDVRPKNVDFGFVISSSYPHKQTTAASSRFIFCIWYFFLSPSFPPDSGRFSEACCTNNRMFRSK